MFLSKVGNEKRYKFSNGVTSGKEKYLVYLGAHSGSMDFPLPC